MCMFFFFCFFSLKQWFASSSHQTPPCLVSNLLQLSVKNCFIRGSVVRYVQLPADEVDTQLLQDAARKEAMQQKQWWGCRTGFRPGRAFVWRSFSFSLELTSFKDDKCQQSMQLLSSCFIIENLSTFLMLLISNFSNGHNWTFYFKKQFRILDLILIFGFVCFLGGFQNQLRQMWICVQRKQLKLCCSVFVDGLPVL